VPFLDLWRGPVEAPRAARHLTLPLHLLAMIAAMLLGILASAQPILSVETARAPGTPATKPSKAPANVSIVAVAAREQPLAQVMVTLRNDSDLTSAAIVAGSDEYSKTASSAG
jgi:hypothetical protein